MKFIRIILKLLPLLTIIGGIFGGGARINPFIDTMKVALTQYELAQIANFVVVDLHGSNKLVKEPQRLPDFIRDRFHNQYSVLAREIKGDKSHDHAVDIWGEPFKLQYVRVFGSVKIFSAGPDQEYNTKDDIAADIPYEDPEEKQLAQAAKKKVIIQEVVEVEEGPETHANEEQFPTGDETLVEGENLEQDQREPAADDQSYQDQYQDQPQDDQAQSEEPQAY
ncbi:hypothetical protein [Peredibacter starrii]|uniref:Uncharacterized protein n=1 Tax=Peredibacter starrii TaxID=28202 RepID=A0AAX4HM16_9BACT|nr:hypothetical protein [Peredibacter starrii]WPU64309.1 hypothetical protein SOO65_16565 [Peredibacter starrii]